MMPLGSRFWPAVALAFLASLSAHAEEWVYSQARGGNGAIEMPSPDLPISVRRYRVQTSARPYVYLKHSVGASEINYFVDEVGRGVVSGNVQQQLNFFAACRREPGGLICIEVYYRADLQDDYSGTIDDIARSFANEGGP